MAHVKIVSPNGWDFERPAATLLKIGSNGLVGHDRQDFIKLASGSENVFLPFIDGVKFAADEEPVHLIALGAKEAYGSNRNGDAFLEKVCRDCHDTFVKFARFYRNHKNKDPGNSYGRVKCSAYNERMRRVELLIALNREKSAAERNGGLVADRELEKLAKDKDLAVSMACRVPYDECSYCGHRARTREEYCTPDMCKAGGCKDNLTRLVKMGGDVHILHVNNPSPCFFDISDVYRPADRIAYGARADWLTKAASDGGFMGIDGARRAYDLGVVAPLAVILAQDAMTPGEWTPYLADQIKLAHGLTHMEKVGEFDMHDGARRAFAADVQPDIDLDALGIDWEKNAAGSAAALGALADQKVVLSLRDFSRMTKRAALADDAGACLKGVYRRMIDDGSLERRVAQNRYAPAEKLASARQRGAAAGAKQAHSLEKEAVARRVSVSTLRGLPVPTFKSGFENEKKASDSPQAEELARDYAVYKLAALRRIAQFDDDFLLTTRLSVCQNQVV